MKLSPLHPEFGMDVAGVSLKQVTAENGYAEIRDAFERHSLLLFRDQHLSDGEQLALGRLFGPLEDREDRPEAKIAPLTNQTDDGLSDADSLHTKSLIANQLWHTDSTFLPVPALANILQARVVPSEGGATEFVSTRAGFARLDPQLQARLRGTTFHHRFAHSRAKIDPELAKMDKITKWGDQSWRAVWPNPVTGQESLYIASHVYAASGIEDSEACEAFVSDLMASMTRAESVYSHDWSPGDVLIWDERATLHRGTAWPYDQPRTLLSICVSASSEDGVEGMRMSA